MDEFEHDLIIISSDDFVYERSFTFSEYRSAKLSIAYARFGGGMITREKFDEIMKKYGEVV